MDPGQHSPVGLTTPAAVQSASDYTHGVSASGTTGTLWFAPTGSNNSWVDAHYNVAGGDQQNLRMSYNAGNGHYETTFAASNGSAVSYFFIYNKGEAAYDSAHYSATVGGGNTGTDPPPTGGDGGSWHGQTNFHIVIKTGGRWADSDVCWSIIGKDWNTGQFVHVDANGQLIPMSTADNGALTRNDEGYTNYLHSLAQKSQVTIPPAGFGAHPVFGRLADVHQGQRRWQRQHRLRRRQHRERLGSQHQCVF